MWAAAYTQNLDSAYRLARAVLRGMVRREEGSIVFIGSIAGLAALGNPLSYGSSKAALTHLSKELARIAGRSSVRVNMVAPGIIKFPGGGWDERMQGPRAEIWRRWIHREMPLDRFGEPSDVASLTAYLLGPISRYVTGTVIPVDGGQMR
jgi:3-oxoacyl-[acyl-carrier protein] reductase